MDEKEKKESQVNDEIIKEMEAAVLESAAQAAEDPPAEASQPEAETSMNQPSEEESGGIFIAEKQEAPDMAEAENAEESEQEETRTVPEEATPAARDLTAEWRELAQAHPEVVGKELPEDIYRACMTSNLPPLRVYETMMLSKQAEEIESLKKEIATLRQNAETAARAPVSAVSGGGAFAEPEDPFIKALRTF